MRFIHTADWHIGRLFHGVSLLEDQAHLLAQLLELIKTSKVDALVIAGDIYDRAVPPADAVKLLDWFFAEVTQTLDVPIIAIAGNHDSAERLGFAASLLATQGLHLRGPLSAGLDPVVLKDDAGPVAFYPIPYAEPALVREAYGVDDIHNHEEALAVMLTRCRQDTSAPRKVAIAHCFVTGGTESESERPLTVGGSGNVSLAQFEGFDYTALGHLHRPQASAERVAYSGSLLKYSFSEAGHIKSVSVVELGPTGELNIDHVSLLPLRDLRIVEGFMEDLLDPAQASNDYLLIRLQDKGAILDAMGRLRVVYPNALHVERPGLLAAGTLQDGGRQQLKRDKVDLFNSFFEQMTGDSLSDEQRQNFAQSVDDLQREEREA